MAEVLRSIEGIRRVERVKGPYDLVVHAAATEGVDAIEQLAGVSRADVCWLSARSKGGGT